jgi:hypothetical protein
MNKFENKLKNAQKKGVEFEDASSECASPEIRKFGLKREYDLGEFVEFDR